MIFIGGGHCKMRTKIIIIISFIFNINLYSQNDIDYEARGSAYNYCTCINKVFPQIEEDIIDIYIESHSIDTFDLLRILSKKSDTFRSDYYKYKKVFTDHYNISQINNCIEEVKNDIHNFDINVIDSGDGKEIFKTNLLKYLGYNFNCKLSIFYLKNNPN